MPHCYPKRSQYKYTRKPYRVRNWREYETALCKRGELTLWFSEEAIEGWHAPASSKPGGQRIYSDLAIETALTVRAVYRLGLRQTEGFLRSVLALLALNVRIPDHSTLSRRSKHLDNIRACVSTANGPVHVLVDSTGLKVHSGRECPDQTRSRRVWRKLHLAVDAVTGEVLASEVATHRSADSTLIRGLLSRIPSARASMTADGAYDVRSVYEAIDARPSDQPTKVIIPPRRNARLSGKSGRVLYQRDQTIPSIRDIGRRRWQKESGYTRRSLVETAIYRYKTIIVRRLRSRTLPSQMTEARLACAIINKMTQQGMPDSYCAA